MIKKYIVLVIGLNLFCVGKTFGWTLYLTNLTKYVVNSHVYWAGCKADHQYLNPGETKAINAYACLHTVIDVGLDDGSLVGSSYRSSGQRTYNQFYIIGPVNGMLMVGRFEKPGGNPNSTIYPY